MGSVTAISVSDSSSDSSVATLIMSEVLIAVNEGLIVVKRACLRQIRGGGRTDNKGNPLPLSLYTHTHTHTYIYVYIYIYINT